MTPAVLETERLLLRPFTLDDAAFTFELVNEPSWLRFVGDRNVKNLDDARRYLTNGPMAMYERHGVGSLVVERKSDKAPLGTCGLIRRPDLPDMDIGFAFLPRYWGQGYALESATATMKFARETLSLPRVIAFTSFDNTSSIRLLEKLGFKQTGTYVFPDETEVLRLFSTDHSDS